MQQSLTWLDPAERTALALRERYEQAGYEHYRMARFEEYSLYQDNRGFLPAQQLITFTDLDGRLLALKPDVTLSIAKNAAVRPGERKKYYYAESVFRPSPESGSFREISQAGLECIGAVGPGEMAEVLRLARESLRLAASGSGGAAVLELGHTGFVAGLLAAAPEAARPPLLEALRAKKAHELPRLCGGWPSGEALAKELAALLTLTGPAAEVLQQARPLAEAHPDSGMEQALDELETLICALEAPPEAPGETPIEAPPEAPIEAPGAPAGAADLAAPAKGLGEPLDDGPSEAPALRLDLSLANDLDYYNGLVFQGYLAGLPRAVLQGGRYDPLASRFSPGAGAVGFAIYLNELERPALPGLAGGAAAAGAGAAPGAASRPMLNIALPKGRLGDQVYALLQKAGYGCGEEPGATRRLVVENPAAGVRYFLVKPSDVAIYVEHGAADVGIVGRDILAEHSPDVYELLDTGLGRCRMCVAGPAGFAEDPARALRVATKFMNIARGHYAAKGRAIDLIQINGSVELAPVLGLSDVIVDIVETGTTLKENGLAVLEEFLPISARLIANKSSWQFKRPAIEALERAFREVTE